MAAWEVSTISQASAFVFVMPISGTRSGSPPDKQATKQHEAGNLRFYQGRTSAKARERERVHEAAAGTKSKKAIARSGVSPQSNQARSKLSAVVEEEKPLNLRNSCEYARSAFDQRSRGCLSMRNEHAVGKQTGDGGEERKRASGQGGRQNVKNVHRFGGGSFGVTSFSGSTTRLLAMRRWSSGLRAS